MSTNLRVGVAPTFNGIIVAEDAVKVPPVDVGNVNAEGNFSAMRGLMSRAAMDVKSGPLGPIVYRNSRSGGRTRGTCGDAVVVVVVVGVPFVRDRRVWPPVCLGSVAEEGRLRRMFVAKVKNLVTWV